MKQTDPLLMRVHPRTAVILSPAQRVQTEAHAVAHVVPVIVLEREALGRARRRPGPVATAHDVAHAGVVALELEQVGEVVQAPFFVELVEEVFFAEVLFHRVDMLVVERHL